MPISLVQNPALSFVLFNRYLNFGWKEACLQVLHYENKKIGLNFDHCNNKEINKHVLLSYLLIGKYGQTNSNLQVDPHVVSRYMKLFKNTNSEHALPLLVHFKNREVIWGLGWEVWLLKGLLRETASLFQTGLALN